MSTRRDSEQLNRFPCVGEELSGSAVECGKAVAPMLPAVKGDGTNGKWPPEASSKRPTATREGEAEGDTTRNQSSEL
jgi:hypothetical protein